MDNIDSEYGKLTKYIKTVLKNNYLLIEGYHYSIGFFVYDNFLGSDAEKRIDMNIVFNSNITLMKFNNVKQDLKKLLENNVVVKDYIYSNFEFEIIYNSKEKVKEEIRKRKIRKIL